MSEITVDEEEKERLVKLAHVFGDDVEEGQAVVLDSGLAFLPSSYRDAAYEIMHEDGDSLDIIDAHRFRTLRDLDEYVQKYEGTGPPPELGHGVA